MVKDTNGQILLGGVEMRGRWAEYFLQLGTECGRVGYAGGYCMAADDSVWNIAISREKNREAVNKMKSCKVQDLDGVLVKCLKKCGMAAVLEWIVHC